MESNISHARSFTALASGTVAGGILTNMTTLFEHRQGVAKGVALGAALLSVAVSAVSAQYLAPAYCQKAVRHREAGDAYAALRTQLKSVRTNVLLNSSVSMQHAEAAVDEVSNKKVNLDNSYKDCLWPDWVHFEVKHQVHAPVPAREPDEDDKTYFGRWTKQFTLQQKKVIESQVQARLREEKNKPSQG
jgi:hypothetical protein